MHITTINQYFLILRYTFKCYVQYLFNVKNINQLCRRFTKFVTMYDLMPKDNLIVPVDSLESGLSNQTFQNQEPVKDVNYLHSLFYIILNYRQFLTMKMEVFKSPFTHRVLLQEQIRSKIKHNLMDPHPSQTQQQ